MVARLLLQGVAMDGEKEADPSPVAEGGGTDGRGGEDGLLWEAPYDCQ